MTLIDNRLALVAALGVTCVVTSCESLPDTQLKSAGQAGQKPSSGGANAGGKAGSGGAGSSATAGKGSAGSGIAGSGAGGTDATGGTGGSSGSSGTGSSGAGAGGKGGTSGKGGTGGTGTDAGNGGEPPTPSGGDNGGGGRAFSTDPATFGGDPRCDAAGVAFCEDFEANSLDTGSWTPRGAAPDIDDTRAMRGSHSAHFHTESNALQLITLKKVFPAPNNTYYARMFVWFDSMPTAPDWAHWTVSGAQADGDEFEVRTGGQYNPQSDKNLFGVGTDHGPTGDWTNLDGDNGEKPVPIQSWVCLEWMWKGDTNEGKLWWDGVEHPSLATSPSKHGGSGTWALPEFDSMWIGWWLYQEDPAPDHYDVWIDEVAVDYARIGCDL